jgi:hypothetical protein
LPFQFRHLDENTRAHMAREIEAAADSGELYFSTRFNSRGTAAWPTLLLQAAQQHTEHWLAYQLEIGGLMDGLEGSRTPSGGYTVRHVPHTAAETMAEGQFNRYYILGVCLRAIASGSNMVTVYRAKAVSAPRPESEALVGQRIDATRLAGEMRSVQQSLRHELLRPNSGLSVHL